MGDLATIFSDLVRLEIELWGAIDARLRAELDLPLSRFEPMQVIERLGSCRVLDIARDLGIGVSGTSKLVDRIELSGYCTRRANPADRRSAIVELTPAGRRLLARAETIFTGELEARIGQVLVPAEQAALAATLRRLRAGGSPPG